MTTTPVLETARLRLRPHQIEDFAACVAMWADPVITRFTLGSPSTEQRTWMRLLAYSGLWTQLGYGYWAVEEKASGRYVGELGFADFKRDSVPGVGGVPELGWALMKQVHGKGYATEGLLAATAWGDAQFGAARTFCIIQSANTASIRVAEKIGYREIHRKDAEGETEIHFARDPWGVAFSRLCPGSF